MNRLRPEVFALIVADPRNECVDVGVGGHVGRQHPQRRAEAGVIAVQRLVEPEPIVVELGGGGDDGGATVEKLGHHRCGDGPLGCAGDDGDLIRVAPGVGTLRAGSNARIQLGVDESTLGQSAAAPPVGLGGHGMTGPFEGLR